MNGWQDFCLLAVTIMVALLFLESCGVIRLG